MATLERDVVLQGKTPEGEHTIDLPITALKNVEDTADVKEKPEAGDYIPLIDSKDDGRMKKTPFSAFGDLGKGGTAKDTTYDNSETKIEADNVQDALDTLLGATLPKLTVKVDAGSELTIQNGDTTLTGKTDTSGSFTTYLPRIGTWKVTATLDGETATDTVSVTAYTNNTVELAFVKIYGVTWDKSSKTTLSRTDDAVLFSDPTPAVNGTGGGSPFDNCAPWKGMVKETLDGNALVKIPKFWYKWTNDGSTLKLQIADKATTGFNVSPAHADRGDGKGERDHVYIGRYKCSSSDYKSVTGQSPKVNITRATARTSIAALGTGYYQQDFAMFWTVRMLYLVEFADWDGQKVIGFGCSNNNSVEKTGSTDSMTYHTGTMKASRETYGVGVQYRWIEDPWGSALEWCDGIRFSGTGVYVYNNPSEFSDTSGGTKTGTRSTSSGNITGWGVPTVSGFDWALYPSTASGSAYETAVADRYDYGSSGVVLCIGGSCSQSRSYGPFCLLGNYAASETNGVFSARLQKLP